MARKPRLHVPGGLYHIILRGNARQDVFFSAGDRHFFYELLSEGVTRFGYRAHAFCLMSNHLHLALQAGESSLSAGMQNLSFRYSRYLNARLGRVGHVFQGRYKAFLVDADRYGLQLVRYIHLNPVRANIVRQPGAHPWSSHRAYLGREALPWLTTDWVLGQFGQRRGTARQRFAAFVEAAVSDGHSELFYGGADDSRVVGEEDFLNGVLKPGERPLKPPPLDHLIDHVCHAYGLTPADLRAPGRNRRTTQARTLIAWLSVQSRSCTIAAVAHSFSRSPSTMSHLVARLEKLSRSSGTLAETLQKHLHTVIQA
jgi:REP element-mobilizing transposase RayT